jgi:predicted  nucleic acid-binding Zn-ribbon protein
MTEEDNLLLNDLKANTQQLFQQFNHLEEEITTLKNKVLSLKSEIELLEKDKLEMSQKNEQLKIATVLLSGVDENRVAKQKINKLVREIDKCIALLNK